MVLPDLAQTLQDASMPAMNAVEHADRHDGGR
jgi:hypothetical protein